MRLEAVTAALRPRPPWEAADLGIRLGQSWWRPILGTWCLLLLPLWGGIFIACGKHLFLALAIVWWLKPVYDRIPLIVVSRGLFDTAPTIAEVVRQLFKERFLLRSLTIYRLSFRRSYAMPVLSLEGHPPQSLPKRLSALSTPPGVTAMQLACCLLECLTTLGVLLLVFMFIPEQYEDLFAHDTFGNLTDSTGDLSTTLVVLLELSYVVGLTVSEIAYAVAGFGLYINRRTYLEGWDIEVAFRALRQRVLQESNLRATRSLLFVTLLLTYSLLSIPALTASSATSICYAQSERSSETTSGHDPAIDKTLARVLADPDFEREIVTEKRYVRKNDASSEPRAPGIVMRAILEIVSWIMLCLLVGFALFALVRGIATRSRYVPPPPPAAAVEPVRELIDVSDLPDDVVSAALFAWQQNDPKGALSLLYRGALAFFSESGELDFHKGDTEQSCVDRVRESSAPVPQQDCFEQVTRTWTGIAYGGLRPTDLAPLLDSWSRTFVRAKGETR